MLHRNNWNCCWFFNFFFTRRGANPGRLLFLLAITVCLTFVNMSTSRNVAQSNQIRRGGDAAPDQRVREGVELTDELGFFEIIGDRYVFVPKSRPQSFRVLENLALERVSTMLSESTSQKEWNVSGLVTEFRGGNYLLIRRAVLKTNFVKSDKR